MHWPPYKIAKFHGRWENDFILMKDAKMWNWFVFFPSVSRIPRIWKKGRGVSTWRTSSPTLNRRFRSTIRAQREIITITLQFDAAVNTPATHVQSETIQENALCWAENRVVSLRWELKKRVSGNTLKLLIVDRNVFIALEQVDVLVPLLGDIITTDITVIAGGNVIRR